MKEINVSDYVKFCLAAKDGIKLRSIINDALCINESITLDFTNISLFASPFFNASIGYLVMKFGIDDFNKKIVLKNLSEVGKLTVDKVIENAIEFKNSDKHMEIEEIINNPDK